MKVYFAAGEVAIVQRSEPEKLTVASDCVM